MPYPWTCISLVAILAIISLAPLQANVPISITDAQNTKTVQIHQTVQHRFQSLDFPFQARYSKQIEQVILDYLGPGRRETEKILDRSTVYFPIFEHYLKKYNLPVELKYIPFIESRLQPHAKSSSGAIGLWQFMPATARGYGLKTNEYLDERLDTHRSTEAAVEMLSELYRNFGDWSLALAAYNCGPGRVKRAMRKTGCNNFWDIKAFLPKQTQKYIPAFLAAIYVVQYSQNHQIFSNIPLHLSAKNNSVKVYQGLCFQDIAATCNLPLQEIKRLNPGYLKQVVPKSKQGHFVVLPSQTAARTLELALSKPQDYALGLNSTVSPTFVKCKLNTVKVPDSSFRLWSVPLVKVFSIIDTIYPPFLSLERRAITSFQLTNEV